MKTIKQQKKDIKNQLKPLTTNEYRIFVGDDTGRIHIFSFEIDLYMKSHEIHQFKLKITRYSTSIQYCPIKNYSICETKEDIQVFLKLKTKELKQITLLETFPNNIFQFSLGTKDAYVRLKVVYLNQAEAVNYWLVALQLVKQLYYIQQMIMNCKRLIFVFRFENKLGLLKLNKLESFGQ